MSNPANDFQNFQCFINGQWTGADSGTGVEVENPANGRVFATVPACSTAQAMRALDGAEQAQAAWQAFRK